MGFAKVAERGEFDSALAIELHEIYVILGKRNRELVLVELSKKLIQYPSTRNPNIAALRGEFLMS